MSAGRALPGPAVQESIAPNLALLDLYDELIAKLELSIARQATRHDADAPHRLRSVPGIGKILYEIHDVKRFSRVQEFTSCARLVMCAHEPAGKQPTAASFSGLQYAAMPSECRFENFAFSRLRTRPPPRAVPKCFSK